MERREPIETELEALQAMLAARESDANAARAAEGLPALSLDPQLVGVARRHSQEMADSGTIFHNPGLAGEVAGRWLLLGENVGMGGSCDDVQDALMKSPAHRKNILEPRFNAVGMGTVVQGGAIYLTQVFMQSGGAPAPPAPRAVPPPPAAKPAPPPAPALSPRPKLAFSSKPKPAPTLKPNPAASPRPSMAPLPPPSPTPPAPLAPAPPSPSPTLPAPSPSVSVQGTLTARSPSPAPGGGRSGGMQLVVGGIVVAAAGIGLLIHRLARKRR